MDSIFDIKSKPDFLKAALETFQYQYENVEVYQRFVDFLNVKVSAVQKLDQIPFLPIEMFKNHTILDKNFESELYFQSSGTTQMVRSSHHIAKSALYDKSLFKSFELFIGAPEEFIILGLLPSYLEKSNSSLIYMVDALMKRSNRPENDYFLYNHEALLELLQKTQNEKVVLFGVSFALLDFLESDPSIKELDLKNLVVIETGGMKGRKVEITKDELLLQLKEGFGIQSIYSEYSMCELLSQAYSLGENRYQCPPWMKVLIRSLDDPMSYLPENKNGALNIIDLANRHSCSFIATQDLGKQRDLFFEVLGRIDHSDVRGCSLLVS
ncbi:LuxE/PaaK family acyltransferase [Chryseobacterium sp. A321]